MLGGIMKIDSTTLSMDAFSSHRDMATTVTDFNGLTSWQKFLSEGGVESHFSMQPWSAPEKMRQSEKEQKQQEESSFSVCKEENSATEESESFACQQQLGGGSSTQEEKGATLLSFGFVEQSFVHCSSQMDFSSSGKVQTADGRTIDFSLDFSAHQEVTTRKAQYIFTDPLVLAIDDTMPSLSDAIFSFDLDSDGEKESLASLSSGSGFLALDKNGDGIINNGYELFGPQGGSGYAELKEYDVDGNMWIDENDPIFDELKIWLGAGSDDARLVSLKEAGVGALSLASVDTAFDMRGKNGEMLGQVARSGLFLKENGEVKSMAEIDLARIPSEEELLGGGIASSAQEAEEEMEDPLLLALRNAILRLEAMLEGRRRESVEIKNDKLLTKMQKDISLKTKFWDWQEEQMAV